MEHYNVHDAKTQFKPVVQMVAVESPPVSERSRLGFLRGHIKVPEDFDRMGQEEIGSSPSRVISRIKNWWAVLGLNQ